MKRLLAKLAVTAIALTAGRAALACEPATPRRPAVLGARVTFAAPVPVPLVTVQRVDDERWERRDQGQDAWNRDGRRGDRRDHDDRWDRDAHERWERARRADVRWERWRAQERTQLRAEYARLDDARNDFYARPHRPGDVHRFEGWYASARADLDARWNRLGAVAWR